MDEYTWQYSNARFGYCVYRRGPKNLLFKYYSGPYETVDEAKAEVERLTALGGVEQGDKSMRSLVVIFETVQNERYERTMELRTETTVLDMLTWADGQRNELERDKNVPVKLVSMDLVSGL